MIKREYYLKLLTSETTELLGSTKSKIFKDINGKSMFHLEVTAVIPVQCNIVNGNYQQNPRALYTFICNKFFVQLLDIAANTFVFLNTFHITNYGLQIKNLNRQM